MNHVDVEPGILRVFKILIAYRMVSWVVGPVAFGVTTAQASILPFWQYGVLIAIQGIALAILLYAPARAWLGRAFLPSVILISTAPLFIEKWWHLMLGTAPEATKAEFLSAFTVHHDFVLILLIIAWQYRFWHAVVYTLAISLLEWAMVRLVDGSGMMAAMVASNELMSRAIIYLLAGYTITWLMRRQREQRQALIAANEQQAQANAKLARYASTLEQLSITRERNRLARELHDTLAHSLSAASVQLEAVNSLWDADHGLARSMLSGADETVRTGLMEARRSLQALRAAPLEELGLALALREAAESAAKRADLTLDLDVPELSVNLPPFVEQGIYRIAQEALENVVRHARAQGITVQLRYDDNEIQLKIEDDGVGFDPQAIEEADQRFGIRGMHERAGMLEGSLEIHSQSGQGTTVCLSVTV